MSIVSYVRKEPERQEYLTLTQKDKGKYFIHKPSGDLYYLIYLRLPGTSSYLALVAISDKTMIYGATDREEMKILQSHFEEFYGTITIDVQ